MDIKWKNRDINVVERAHIPEFCNLDEVVTPLRLLIFIFDDILVEIMFGYTKLDNHREKAGISFEITNEKNR